MKKSLIYFLFCFARFWLEWNALSFDDDRHIAQAVIDIVSTSGHFNIG